VGLDHHDTAAACECAIRFVEEARRIGEVVEDVEHDDVRERPVDVGEIERVDSLVDPWRLLDVGQYDPVPRNVAQAADPGPQLDAATGDGGETVDDLPVPVAVEAPEQGARRPRSFLRAKCS